MGPRNPGQKSPFFSSEADPNAFLGPPRTTGVSHAFEPRSTLSAPLPEHFAQLCMARKAPTPQPAGVWELPEGGTRDRFPFTLSALPVQGLTLRFSVTVD